MTVERERAKKKKEEISIKNGSIDFDALCHFIFFQPSIN